MTVHDDSQKQRAVREDEGQGCVQRTRETPAASSSKPPLVSSAQPTSHHARTSAGFMFKLKILCL